MPDPIAKDEGTASHIGSTAHPPLAPAVRWAQAVALLATLAAGGYLIWRWGFTLDGTALWLGLPLLLAETYGFVMLMLLAYSCWRTTLRTSPPPLAGRRVAVLVATFDEDEDVLRPTVVGALGIRNDVPPEVWVLDDGGRAWVSEMCDELGARYVSRPAPRAHAKAGNINHALQYVDAEFLVTLDADHVPRPELLERMLGHMADPQVAVVQGPQSFFNRGFGHPRRHEDPLRNEQSIFFDVILPGKDRHASAFWCGCPSVVRRAALMDIGGVATRTVVEDAHTSLVLNRRGWRVVYHHEVMALGLAPEEIGAFVVQRGRWARGSIQMLRLEWPMFRRGLTWAQRIEYSASCLHFFEGLQRVIGFAVPSLVLATGAVPIAAAPALYLMVFLPQFVLVPLTSWALTRGRYRPLEGERYAVVRMEGYLRALAALPRGRGRGFAVTPKGARSGESPVLRALRVPLALAALALVAVAVQTAAQVLDWPNRLTAGAATVTMVWALVNVALIVYAVFWASGVQHRRRSHRFPVSLTAAWAPDDGGLPSLTGHIDDLGRHGARLIVDVPRDRGDRVRLVILLEDGPVEVTGRVATVKRIRGTEQHRVGVAFDPMDAGMADAIVTSCFRNPFGPAAPATPPPAQVPAPTLRPAPAPAMDVAFLAAAETASATEGADDPEAGTAGP
ncbi:MAG TPA: glycosyltransferase [Miltoncostaeaceae bacterium]|nr:glycosyltransferase [Miltoncostaeaceae bacterium]